MLVIGVILLVIGYLLHIQVLWIIGVVLAVAGAILLVLSAFGHAVGGRRWY